MNFLLKKMRKRFWIFKKKLKNFNFFCSAHHCDQMSEESQVSKVTLCVKILKWQPKRPLPEVNISSHVATCVATRFNLSCRNIQIRVFRANIFKSECFVQKYWSGTVTRYSVMRGCLFGSDQTKYYVHGCNFHSFSGPFIHKKWGKIDVLYDRRQVTYFTMQKKCIFWV